MSKQQPKLMLLALVAMAAIVFTACNNNEQARKDIDDLQAYVDERRDSVDRYLDKKWEDMEATFEEKRTKLEKDTAKWGQDFRDSYNEVVDEWQEFKNDFATRKEEKRKVAEADELRKSLAIDEVKSDFTDVRADNILKEYRHFVQTVETNKDIYTSDQWLVVNNSWKNLNGRKKEIAKDISRGDNAEITNLQLKYTGIKAVNRPFADNE